MVLKPLLKIAFSLGILAVLFHEIHLKDALPYFKQMHFSYLSLAIITITVSTFIASIRWLLVMKTLGAPSIPSFYLKTFFKSFMFNQILPSSIGGDGYRMYEVTKLGISKQLAINSVLSDRIIGFSGMVIISVLSLPISYRLLTHQLFLLILTILLFCVIAICGVICLRLIKIKLLERYFSWFYALSNTLHGTYSTAGDLLTKVSLSLFTNFSNTLSFYFIARALHIPCHLAGFLVIIPIVSLLIMIPISMAGWGIREGAMVTLGATIGIHHPGALAISLMSGLILIINSLPGFYLYFIHNEKYTYPRNVTS